LIRHISFDLWLTLIKSNPLFKQKRAEFLAENFNPKGFSTEEVLNIVHCVDKACDKLNEKSGEKRKACHMYHSVLKRLAYNINKEHHSFLDDIVSKINLIFFEYPPVLLNGNITHILSSLKAEGYTLNISSNTGFIEGKFLREFLKMEKIDHYFDFAVFSDEINASKPSYSFFDNVFGRIKNEKHEVLHVGDNYNADFMGASQYGFNVLLIENRDYSYELIKQTIDEKNRKL
jgi:putative hydrolase of the HAD superfamily